MKLRTLFLFPVALICLAGCGLRSADVPEKSFRLTVTDLLTSDEECVSIIKIQTRETQTYSVRAQSFFLAGGSSKAVAPAAAATEPHREQAITLMAYRHGGQDRERDWAKAVLKTECGNTFTDGRWLAHGSALTNVVLLGIHDGIYPLSKPLVIARLFGEEVLLTVGDIRVETAKQ